MIQIINFLGDYLLDKLWDLPFLSIFGCSVDKNLTKWNKDFSLI